MCSLFPKSIFALTDTASPEACDNSVSIVVMVLAKSVDGEERRKIITKPSIRSPVILQYSSMTLFISNSIGAPYD